MHREMVISLLSAETRRRGKSLVPRANSLCSTAQAGSACLPVCPIARSNRVTPPEGGFSQQESRFLAQRRGRSSPSPFFPRTWTVRYTVWKCPRKSPEGCARKNGMQITSRCLCFCHQPLHMFKADSLFLAHTNEIFGTGNFETNWSNQAEAGPCWQQGPSISGSTSRRGSFF